jgi:signal recognition particle subunit SRP68
MSMKSMHAAESSKAIVGSTRKHIISRLRKAERHATQLLDLVRATERTDAHDRDLVEAKAYCAMLGGSVAFEARRWETCLTDYSEAFLIYTALAHASIEGQGDIFRELLSTTVEPSIRYAAYQQRLPRTLGIAKIVHRYQPKDSDELALLQRVDPSLAGDEDLRPKAQAGLFGELPRTITWRTRTVNLEDANVAQALAAARSAEERLAAHLAASQGSTVMEKASAYDDLLEASQDAVNATKSAIEELAADGVAQGDPRMQSLQVTRTAVNYALVGWRIGRNRVLCGRDDGAHLDSEPFRKGAKSPVGEGKQAASREEGIGRKLARLRERVALYDTTIQSLDSVNELPGVAADQSLIEELHVQRSYFSALR